MMMGVCGCSIISPTPPTGLRCTGGFLVSCSPPIPMASAAVCEVMTSQFIVLVPFVPSGRGIFPSGEPPLGEPAQCVHSFLTSQPLASCTRRCVSSFKPSPQSLFILSCGGTFIDLPPEPIAEVRLLFLHPPPDTSLCSPSAQTHPSSASRRLLLRCKCHNSDPECITALT